MSTLMQHKHVSIQNPSTVVKCESKNRTSSRITASDMIGLTWIFKKDEDLLDELK